MTKYKTEKRKANVGERILITDKHVNETRYKNGDVFEVTQRKRGYVWSEMAVNILDYEYEVIVGVQTPAPNILEVFYVLLRKGIHLSFYDSKIVFSTQDIGTARLIFKLHKDGMPLPLSAVEGKLVLLFSNGSKHIRNITLSTRSKG
ncbi:phage baseplate upper protein [Bacillus sp. FJAT-53060]|nr:phage baseplate upper protein [Bacillus stratosphericus]